MESNKQTTSPLQEIRTEDTSLVFKVKRTLLTNFKDFRKNIDTSIRTRGNRRFKEQLLSKKVPQAYKQAAKAPIDENKVVFIEVRHPKITNSLQVMFDELTNNYDYTVHTHFLLNSGTIRADYEKRCTDMARDVATAKYVFLNEGSNVVSALPLREGTKIIQLWHGCGAFKKFGFSTADLIFGESRKDQLKHPFNKNYSLVTVSSPEVVWAYNEAMNIDENSGIVQPTGSSRTDVFYDEEFKSNAYDHVYETVPQAKGKKIILYAPTFRGRVAHAETPDMLNFKMFYEALGDEYVLLLKHHPVVKSVPTIPEEYKNFAIDVGNVLSIEELLIVSDICISDYSSLVFEYSLFERPLIFFAYDLDEYFDWRGFYYDYFELAPGLIAKTNFEMIDYIKNIDTRFDKKAIQDFRQKFMSSCDGHATQRIIETAFENPEKHRKPCENFEHFYTVPKVESSKLPYIDKIKKARNRKEKAEKLYSQFSNTTVTPGYTICLDIKSKEIKYIAKKQGLKFVSSKNLETAIEEIGKAQYIIIDRANTLLDSIDLKADTKVVFLAPNAFPLNKFGSLTKLYRSGLRKEMQQIAPLNKSVGIVAAPNETSGALFKSAFDHDVEILPIGDVKTDVLFDEEYRAKALKKLYAAYPKLEGRKIITFISTNGEVIDDSSMYEYLYKDYVLLKIYSKSDEQIETLVYYSDSIVDVSGQFTPYEALAMCDIAIGDINAYVLSFAAKEKPMFLYSTNTKKFVAENETFVDVEKDIEIPIYDNIMDIINSILDIDNYDLSGCIAIKNKYLTNCNSNSLGRLIEQLNKEETI